MSPTAIRPGFVLWLMGPTSSGKSTLSNAVAERLRELGAPIIHFDGDEVRDFFGDNLGFKPEDRLRVVGTLIHLADKVSKAGTNVIVSALTVNPDARKLLNENLGQAAIGFIQCSMDTCAARDPKGLYAKAKSGEIDTLVGYKAAWRDAAGLRGMINWYRASPLRLGGPGERLENALTFDPARLQIRCPHLLIWGKDDTALLPESTEGLEDFAPNLTRVSIDGADHWLHHQKPDEIADAILRWL